MLDAGLKKWCARVLLVVLLLLGSDTRRVVAEEPAEATVFKAGESSYHTFRIPTVVLTNEKTLLAFCEARKSGRDDDGDIDLVLKRSSDGGQTWGPLEVVYEEGGAAKTTIGNPAPVVEQKSGTIWLPFTRNNDDVFVTHSTDDGRTWAKPVKITALAKAADWDWYATGPVHAIQLTRGKHAGRLVVPCDHRMKSQPGQSPGEWKKAGRSHMIYSDDAGKTWQLGQPTDVGMNECSVAEMTDGSLLLNMRSYRGKGQRAAATSRDGGVTWTECVDQEALIEPVCQGSLLRYTWANEHGKSRLLFSNPASTKSRDRLTVRLSYDEGQTWPIGRVVCEGSSAYSDLVALPDLTIGLLYERDDYRKIAFARFSLEWLSDGKDRVEK